jgi:hypothetical protein
LELFTQDVKESLATGFNKFAIAASSSGSSTPFGSRKSLFSPGREYTDKDMTALDLLKKQRLVFNKKFVNN